MIDRSLREILLERLDAAEIAVDPFGEAALRLATAVRAERLPQKIMVPDLRGVVENLFVGGIVLAMHLEDQLLEVHLRHVGALGQRVELIDIGLVMLAVVKLQRFRRHMRLECVHLIGQRLKCEHGTPLGWGCRLNHEAARLLPHHSVRTG